MLQKFISNRLQIYFLSSAIQFLNLLRYRPTENAINIYSSETAWITRSKISDKLLDKYASAIVFSIAGLAIGLAAGIVIIRIIMP